MKKIFKNWEWYEIVFLVAGLLIISLCFVFSSIKNNLSFFSSIVGIITVILMAK